ncbi:hypothetical protein BKA93DRAFT_748422 [Sparassis latifolia]
MSTSSHAACASRFYCHNSIAHQFQTGQETLSRMPSAREMEDVQTTDDDGPYKTGHRYCRRRHRDRGTYAPAESCRDDPDDRASSSLVQWFWKSPIASGPSTVMRGDNTPVNGIENEPRNHRVRLLSVKSAERNCYVARLAPSRSRDGKGVIVEAKEKSGSTIDRS